VEEACTANKIVKTHSGYELTWLGICHSAGSVAEMVVLFWGGGRSTCMLQSHQRLRTEQASTCSRKTWGYYQFVGPLGTSKILVWSS
jgi:hypothetical protein